MGLQYDILMLDLNPNPCPLNQCPRLPELIQNFLPSSKILFEKSKTRSNDLASLAPEVILFRPSPHESLEELTLSLNREWEHSAVIALFCAGWENTGKVLQSLQYSGDDFISCPFRETDLFLRVQRLLQRSQESASLARVKAIREKLHVESLVGESQRFLELVEKVPALARSNAAVVINGETGTGKELFARAIHYQGPRKGKPFIPVNCGALPDHLFENELFGHAKGAYTDASSAEKGLIAEAEGGTLFLDEIGALSPTAQIKLLRFLQNGEYRSLGSARPLLANVRVIAATNDDLKDRVRRRLFREDLFYRLNILSLTVPPLRERSSDIPRLASHFLAMYGKQSSGKTCSFSEAAIQKLIAYSWPGNVRELEGVVQRAVVLSRSEVFEARDIDLSSTDSEQARARDSLREAKSLAVEEFERRFLLNLLAMHRGNITQAAKAAGKDRRTLQRLVRRYGLDRHSFKL